MYVPFEPARLGWPGLLAAAILCSIGSLATAEVPTGEVDLRSARRAGTVDQVERTMEVAGSLQLPEADGKATQQLHVKATFHYHERILGRDEGHRGHLLAARYYDQAAARITIDKDAFTCMLPAERRLIGVQVSPPQVLLFSPTGPLTREQLDLIDIAADTALLDMLLPDHPVVAGQSWTHSNELLSALLRLDAVIGNDVQSVLKEVTGDVARVEISGNVEGAVQGSSTKIELKGRYHFNLQEQRITWVGVLIKEKRGAGPVSPGLNVVARVVATITPESPCTQLSDEAIAAQPIEPGEESLRLVFRPLDASWELLYDRRWFITAQEKQMLVLRLLDRGVFVGQCKVVTGSPGHQLSLDRFQQDIREALGEKFGQFVRAAERPLQPSGRMLEVWVQGEVAEVPVRWMYYAVQSDRGPSVVLAFVSEEQLADQFAQAQRSLLGGLRLATEAVASRAASPQ